MSASDQEDAKLPQIVVCNASNAPGIDVDHVVDGPDQANGLLPMLINILANLQQGGVLLESIHYPGTPEDPDCIITIHSDRPDWDELVTDRGADTGETPQQPDWLLLAQRALELGLGSGMDSGQVMAKRAAAAGVTITQDDKGRRSAIGGSMS